MNPSKPRANLEWQDFLQTDNVYLSPLGHQVFSFSRWVTLIQYNIKNHINNIIKNQVKRLKWLLAFLLDETRSTLPGAPPLFIKSFMDIKSELISLPHILSASG